MLRNIQHIHIDYLNIVLIILSLVLAIIFPFELFVVVYAILGPLHYLTEINWLHHKKYFLNSGNLFWLFLILAFFFAVPFLLKLPVFENSQIKIWLNNASDYTNNFIFFAFIFSAALVLLKKRKHQLIFIVASILIALFSQGAVSDNILIGSFLATIIHVYIFTFLFMVYGSLKSKSLPGLIASLFVIAVPIIIFSFHKLPVSYTIPEWAKSIFIDNNFHFLNLNIAKTFGLSDGNAFYFYETSFLKIQIFLAFAYTYHYLNWFSKTSIIGWYKSITKRNSIIIAAVWILTVVLYAVNYKTGFILLVFLSTLHVFLEFPLNVLSIKGIVAEIKKQF